MLSFKEHVLPLHCSDVITLLCEADYMNMLPKEYVPKYGTMFSDLQTWARQVLKKDNRIVWFLRHVRDVIINPGPAPLKSLTTPIWSSNGVSMSLSVSGLKSELAHYYSLPIAKIQSYQVSDESVKTLLTTFEKFEDEWKEQRKGLITSDMMEGDETIAVKVDSDWNWWLLPRGGCEVEGDAMGHCGNMPSQKPGDKIYSLRKTVRLGSEEAYEPALTFIVDKDGWLGESKGRGNDKPADKYHPAIIKLLQSGLIVGIFGGGYLPESNFTWDDLSDSNKKAVASKNPMFIGDLSTATAKQLSAHPNLIQNLLDDPDGMIATMPWARAKCANGIVTYSNAASFVEILTMRMDTNAAKQIARNIDNGPNFYSDGSVTMEDLFSYRNLSPVMNLIMAKMNPEARKAMEDDDLSIGDAIEQYDEEVQSALQMAFEYAMNDAEESTRQRAVLDYINDILSALGPTFEWAGSLWEPGAFTSSLEDFLQHRPKNGAAYYDITEFLAKAGIGDSIDFDRSVDIDTKDLIEHIKEQLANIR